MAEKYQARNNNVDEIEDVLPKTKKQERQESSAKVAKVAAKGAAEYFAPGVGGKAVDMISQTKAGQQVLDRAGKILAKNPITGRVAKKLDDQGAVDLADKATDLISGKSGTSSTNLGGNKLGNSTTNNVGNNSSGLNNMSKKTTPNLSGNTKNNLSTNDSDANAKEQSKEGSEREQTANSKKGKNDDLFNNLFGNGSITKLIKTKYLFIGCGVFFAFILVMTLIVSAKDFGNLDMTNNSNAMGNYSPEFIGAVTPESISKIDGNSLDGGQGTILSGGKTLYSVMGAEGVDLLNHSIELSTQLAGYGTGAASAAAAHTLIQNLLNIGVVLPYFWGGGHGIISKGADGNWGTYNRITTGGHFTSFSKQSLGLDCSGFVSWALYNGGCKSFTPITAANFKNLGPSISFSSAKTGDIAASNTHVVLILENRGANLLVAEAKGTASGVVFSLRSEKNLKRYTIVDMSGYYQTNCS